MQSALAVNLDAPCASLPSKTHPQRPKAYSQCTAMQALVQKDIEDPNTPPSIRAGCVRAWDILEERKRILRGKPLPGYLRHQLPTAKTKSKRVALLATMADEPKESPAGPSTIGQPGKST